MAFSLSAFFFHLSSPTFLCFILVCVCVYLESIPDDLQSVLIVLRIIARAKTIIWWWRRARYRTRITGNTVTWSTGYRLHIDDLNWFCFNNLFLFLFWVFLLLIDNWVAMNSMRKWKEEFAKEKMLIQSHKPYRCLCWQYAFVWKKE